MLNTSGSSKYPALCFTQFFNRISCKKDELELLENTKCAAAGLSPDFTAHPATHTISGLARMLHEHL
jgi:hypothetical protein